jgi:Tfp pilus assembly PilM family ATPase
VGVVCGVELSQEDMKYVVAQRHRRGLRILRCGRIPTDPDRTPGSLLAELLQEQDISGARLRIALSTQTAHLKILSLPPMPRREMTQVLRQEIERELEILPGELAYGYEILPRRSSRDPYRVLLAITSKRAIRVLEEDLESHGLRAETVTLGSLALLQHVRTLLRRRKEDEVVGVLHLGSHYMVLAVVGRDTIRLVRDVAVGVEADLWADAEATGTDGAAPQADPLETISKGLDEIVRVSQQIRRTLEFDGRSHPGAPVRRLLLAGDVTRAQELVPILSNDVGIPVEILDPVGGMVADEGPLGDEAPVYAFSLALALSPDPERIPNLASSSPPGGFPWGQLRRVAIVWTAALFASLAVPSAQGIVRMLEETREVLSAQRARLLGHDQEVSLPVELLGRLGGWSGALPTAPMEALARHMPEEARLQRLSVQRTETGFLVDLRGEIRSPDPQRRLKAWEALLTALQADPSVEGPWTDPVEGRGPRDRNPFPFGIHFFWTLPGGTP